MKWSKALSINEELKRAFQLASLRQQARFLTEPRQWRETSNLLMRCEAARTREKDLYQERYEARVENRRRKLIDEAGQVRREHRPVDQGRDRFDPQATLRQAHNDVRNAHAGRIARIEEFERAELGLIVERARRESALRGMAQGAFDRAADRRSGLDRRRPRDR